MKTPPGLIVTYNPPHKFFTHLNSFYTQLDQIVLVDNGSNPETQRLLAMESQRRKSLLTVIFNQTNLGVATALNQGFRWALKHGYSQIIAFDQDSQPTPGMVPAMLKIFSAYAEVGRIAVLAPAVREPLVNIQSRYLRSKNSIFFEMAPCNEHVLENISTVITSGSLYNLAAYKQLGPFRDDFFIDYVDTEYCLRANQSGYQVLVACYAYLHHSLGERQKRVFMGRNYYPTFHSPLRWYYISRNRLPMLKNYAVRFPHWFLYEVFTSINTFKRMLLFETQKATKLRAFFLGTLDGIRGRMGKATDEIIRKLQRPNPNKD